MFTLGEGCDIFVCVEYNYLVEWFIPIFYDIQNFLSNRTATASSGTDAEPTRNAPQPPYPASGGSNSSGRDSMMSTDSTET